MDGLAIMHCRHQVCRETTNEAPFANLLIVTVIGRHEFVNAGIREADRSNQLSHPTSCVTFPSPSGTVQVLASTHSLRSLSGAILLCLLCVYSISCCYHYRMNQSVSLAFSFFFYLSELLNNGTNRSLLAVLLLAIIHYAC